MRDPMNFAGGVSSSELESTTKALPGRDGHGTIVLRFVLFWPPRPAEFAHCFRAGASEVRVVPPSASFPTIGVLELGTSGGRRLAWDCNGWYWPGMTSKHSKGMMSIASFAAPARNARRPSSLRGALRQKLFGVSIRETSFARRGFRSHSAATRARLESIGGIFLVGYHAGLAADRSESLAAELDSVVLADRGFAFEGAGMALALLDRVTPWRRNRFAHFVEGVAAPHVYMAHIGAGWALARLGRRFAPATLPFDPLMRWLVIDGFGFHEGYFATRRAVDALHRPSWLCDYATCAFDQGLGRSLWFIEGGDDAAITRRIARFPADRRADLWSGVGLAATYAGGVADATLVALREASGEHLLDLAQGAAFAAQARVRACNSAPHTDAACNVFTHRSATAAATLTDQALAQAGDPAASST